MRVSCNGCRVLRKGCSEDCTIRPCLAWIKSPESQANATVFLAKFYGRAGLMNLINAGPDHLRPAIFRSLLYEACGRIVNPIYGSVGLLWSGSWQLCQTAVEAVLKGAPITPIASEAAASSRGPPLKVHDIRHVSRDRDRDDSPGDLHAVRNRCRFKRTGPKSRVAKGQVRSGKDDCCEGEPDWSPSHESSLSHQSEGGGMGGVNVDGDSKEADSVHSVETAEPGLAFTSEPELDESDVGVGLELTLGLGPGKPASRESHVVPVKKRRYERDETDGWDCQMGLGL